MICNKDNTEKCRRRERERGGEFYLTPDHPGCVGIVRAADTAESPECSMSACLLGGSMYRSGGGPCILQKIVSVINL